MKSNSQLCSLTGLTFVCACLLAAHSVAAEKLGVSDEQVKKLGIELVGVQDARGGVKQRFPAQVVVPPKAEHVVSAPLQGLVVQLLVGEFQPVKKGDAVAKLSSPAMSQLQLQALQASARATLARQAYAREQALFKEGIIPQRRAQEAQAALREADATLAQAKSELALAGMSGVATDKMLRSGVPTDSLILEAAQDGVVSAISVKPGQRVDAATAVLSITQLDTLWLDVQLPIEASKGMRPGMPIEIPGKQLSGRVLSLSPTISASTQFVILRAEVDGAAGQLRPGELVTVDVPLEAAGQAWDLPLSAVARNKDESVVFVKTAGGFEARPVRVQNSAGQLVRVEGDIGAEDRIAVSGVIALKGAWLQGDEE